MTYILGEINDIEIMEHVRISACPFDAVESVKAIANITLDLKGGEGCVREFIDDYLM